MQQSAPSVFMVRPAHFGFNEQTADSNVFQHQPELGIDLSQKALLEFDAAVENLRKAGALITIFEDEAGTVCPDAVFPNNWISTHADGTVILYPMFTPNRRLERRADIVAALQEHYQVSRILDLSSNEQQGTILEGTGSIVFDHDARKAYACLSPRTHESLLLELSDLINYEPVAFHSTDKKGKEVYHTNVIMGIASSYAIVCLESITREQERTNIVTQLNAAGKEVIDISWEQTLHFCGNILELEDQHGSSLLALSAKAFAAFTTNQISRIEKYSNLVPLEIPTIETIGGGSVRCMIAQNFLPRK